MATDRKLIDCLPHFLQEFRELSSIMDAEQPEFDALDSEAKTALADQFIESLTEKGVRRWESLLGISPKDTDTLDERKFRIVTKLQFEPPYTLRKLEQVLTTLCGAKGYFIELIPGSYQIKVKLAVGNRNNYSEVENILNRIIPANMLRHVEIMYNANSLLSQFTHAQLSAYTHEQLRNEVIS